MKFIYELMRRVFSCSFLVAYTQLPSPVIKCICGITHSHICNYKSYKLNYKSAEGRKFIANEVFKAEGGAAVIYFIFCYLSL